MENKAEGLAINKLIILIIVVLVVAISIYAIFRFGLIDYLKNLFPSFGPSK